MSLIELLQRFDFDGVKRCSGLLLNWGEELGTYLEIVGTSNERSLFIVWTKALF